MIELIVDATLACWDGPQRISIKRTTRNLNKKNDEEQQKKKNDNKKKNAVGWLAGWLVGWLVLGEV